MILCWFIIQPKSRSTLWPCCLTKCLRSILWADKIFPQNSHLNLGLSEWQFKWWTREVLNWNRFPKIFLKQSSDFEDLFLEPRKRTYHTHDIRAFSPLRDHPYVEATYFFEKTKYILTRGYFYYPKKSTSSFGTFLPVFHIFHTKNAFLRDEHLWHDLTSRLLK